MPITQFEVLNQIGFDESPEHIKKCWYNFKQFIAINMGIISACIYLYLYMSSVFKFFEL